MSQPGAIRAVADAIRRGDLVRQPCEECGCEPTQAHHDDYAKPLEVRWLCGTHHRLWHSANGSAPGKGKEAILTFWLPPHEKEQIEAIAQLEERTVSALMRLLVRDRIAKEAT